MLSKIEQATKGLSFGKVVKISPTDKISACAEIVEVLFDSNESVYVEVPDDENEDPVVLTEKDFRALMSLVAIG